MKMFVRMFKQWRCVCVWSFSSHISAVAKIVFQCAKSVGVTLGSARSTDIHTFPFLFFSSHTSFHPLSFSQPLSPLRFSPAFLPPSLYFLLFCHFSWHTLVRCSSVCPELIYPSKRLDVYVGHFVPALIAKHKRSFIFSLSLSPFLCFRFPHCGVKKFESSTPSFK